MDFGGSDNNNSGYHFGFGSGTGGLVKQESSVSSATAHNDDDWKVAKTNQDDHFSKPMMLHQQQQQQQQHISNTTSLYSDSHNMLSFSSPNSHQTLALPHYARNTTTGYGCGGSVRGVIAGVKGPFTPSQWMELEHQALIYKYITLNAPIPSNLLIPIRKALESAAFSGTHLRHPSYGWGGFHLGFSNSSDPEPGRCRRTDGKKWRCSRDAVADQKYCERHMNRGRHRSRKPVEGQTAHSVSTTAAAKVSPSAAVVTTTSTIVSHLQQHQLGRMQPGSTPNPAAYSHDNRNFLNKESVKLQDSTPSIGVKESPSEFGLVCSDSLLNPLQKNENGVQKSQNSLRQFMDDWPHSERTQLSISIPMGSASSSDFMSATSSPISERLNLSPLRMGMKVGNVNVFGERSQQASWIPVSWESSMGGPLGEVLNHNSTNNSPSALNLMTDGWESSQQMTLSPTGVLQKTVFGSVSNSSAGSSPRTDNNLLGSTLIASSLPLL